MSKQVIETGKLKKVDLQGKTLEEWCKSKMGHGRPDEPDLPEAPWFSFQEMLLDQHYLKYMLLHGTLYEVIGFKSSDDMEFINTTLNPDGTISFVCSYYNGGGSLEECLEIGLTRSGME